MMNATETILCLVRKILLLRIFLGFDRIRIIRVRIRIRSEIRIIGKNGYFSIPISKCFFIKNSVHIS